MAGSDLPEYGPVGGAAAQAWAGGRVEGSGALGGEQRGDQGLRDELAIPFGWPSATGDQQFVEFGRTIGPRDIGGLFHCDAGPQMAGCGQAAGVDGHPLQAGGVDLVHKGGDVWVSGGSVPGQQVDSGNPGGELGSEGAPG